MSNMNPLIFIILFAVFAVRAIPRLIIKNCSASDSFYHLHCARIIRKNRFKIPEKFPNLILDHTYNYPFLYHFILALFPFEKQRETAERFTGAVLDSIYVFFCYIFADYYCSEILKLENSQIPLFYAFLTGMSPVFLRIGFGPRAFNGSPRILGQILYFIHFASFNIWLFNGNTFFLAAAVFSCALLFISAKFSVQVLIFYALVFVCVTLNYRYIFIILLSFLISNIITLGRTFKVFAGQINHSIFYCKYLQKKYLFENAIVFNTLKNYLKNASIAFELFLKSGKINAFINWFTGEQYFLHLLFTVFPHIILVIYFYEIKDFLYIWALSGFIFYLLTKTKYLLFLGEGERYIEYSIPASLLIFVIIFSKINFGIFLLIILCSLYLLLAVYYSVRYITRYLNVERTAEADREIFSKLNELPDGNIMQINSIYWSIFYYVNKKLLFYSGNFEEKYISKSEFDLLFSKFPCHSGRFADLVKQYSIKYIAVRNEELDKYLTNTIDNKESFYNMTELVVKNFRMAIYKVK